MKHKSIEKTVVDEYFPEFADLPALTLARKIYNENKKVFKSIDQVRSIIRYYRGKRGKYSEHHNDGNGPGHYANIRGIPNPFSLPESDEVEFLPVQIQTAAKSVLIISDTHIPYHNIPAITAVFQYAQGESIDTIILDGHNRFSYHYFYLWQNTPQE